jgi:hypothetical protein
LNFTTLPFKLTRIHDYIIATIHILSFDASVPNLENRDAINGNIAEKEMLPDAFLTSFRSLTMLALCGSQKFPRCPSASLSACLCHSFALEYALALRRRLEIPPQATNLGDRECSAGRWRLVPAGLESWHVMPIREMKWNHSSWANAFGCRSIPTRGFGAAFSRRGRMY